MARYLGVDLHRHSFTVCTRTADEQTQLRTWKMSELSRFVKQLHARDEVAVEATGNTRYFCEALQEKVARVVVVNPHQFEVISRSVKKTDGEDAEKLALFLSKGLLPEVRMKEKHQAQVASLAQTRDKLVKARTALKNKVSNVLAGQGHVLKKEGLSSEAGLQRVLKLEMDELVKLELEVLVEQIRSLNQGIAKIEKRMKDEGKQMPGPKNLTSIKGIGETSASILLSVIGDVNDFADEGKLASYFGMVPRVEQSADTERRGHISKQGSKLGRTTLVQCTLIAKRYSPYLQQFYERVKARRGSGKAIIATARKFLGIIYHTLKNNWVFEDFPNFVIAQG